MEPTLSRDAYVDDDWFGRERDRIFFNQWFCVGRLEEIPQPDLHTPTQVPVWTACIR